MFFTNIYCRFDQDALNIIWTISDGLTYRQRNRPNPNNFGITVEIPDDAGHHNFKRYYDHVVRTATLLHILNKMADAVVNNIILESIPKVIPCSTVLQAKKFVDMLYLQKRILLQVRLPNFDPDIDLP